jgi:gamma-glutamyl-gamma-aminobutyrate hydrolase PuuD
VPDPAPRNLLIGLSPRILRKVPAEVGFRGKTLQYLEQSMATWTAGGGALVVMIPTVERQSIIQRPDLSAGAYAEALDGLVLQGGADIDPVLYASARTDLVGETDAVRDRFELDLLRAFAAAGKPVLGICRGMQLINVAFGGTLHHDLQAAGASAFPHHEPELYDEHAHTMRFTPGGWLQQLYGGISEARVNSIHHQGIEKLGEGLRIEAVSEDGVIECIRRDEPRFIVGVQWHPEFHDGRFPELLSTAPLLQAFLDAAITRRGS